MQDLTVEEVLIKRRHKESSALAYVEALKSLGFIFLEKESLGIDDKIPYRVILSKKAGVGIGVTYTEYVDGIKFSYSKADQELGTLGIGLSIIEEHNGIEKPFPDFEFVAKLYDRSNFTVRGKLTEKGSLVFVQIKHKKKGKKSVDALIGNEDGAIPIGTFVRPENLSDLIATADLVSGLRGYVTNKKS